MAGEDDQASVAITARVPCPGQGQIAPVAASNLASVVGVTVDPDISNNSATTNHNLALDPAGSTLRWRGTELEPWGITFGTPKPITPSLDQITKAAAGLLRDRPATTHWSALDELSGLDPTIDLRTGERRTWARDLVMPNGLVFLPNGDAVVSWLL